MILHAVKIEQDVVDTSLLVLGVKLSRVVAEPDKLFYHSEMELHANSIDVSSLLLDENDQTPQEEATVLDVSPAEVDHGLLNRLVLGVAVVMDRVQDLVLAG